MVRTVDGQIDMSLLTFLCIREYVLFTKFVKIKTAREYYQIYSS